MGLTREQIFRSSDLKKETIHVPEWDGELYIQELSGRARMNYEIAIQGDYVTGTQVMTELIALSCVDMGGDLLFQKFDIDKVADKSMNVLLRLFDACRKINGLDQASIDNAIKNTEATTDGVSISD